MKKLLNIAVYLVLGYATLNLLVALYGNLFMNGAVHGSVVLGSIAAFGVVVLLTAIYKQLEAVVKPRAGKVDSRGESLERLP